MRKFENALAQHTARRRALRTSTPIELKQGIRYTQVRPDAFGITLRLWTLKEKHFDIGIVEQLDIHGSAVDEYLRDPTILLGINGGFFERDSEKRLSPSGALVVNGVIRNGINNFQSGALVKRGGTIEVLWSHDVKDLCA